MTWTNVLVHLKPVATAALAGAATGYVATGTWQGAVAAALTAVAALYKSPPGTPK